MTTTIRDDRLPLLRQAFPAIPAIDRRPKVAISEAKTQRPLIIQGKNSFVSQFDGTLATYSGCPYKCKYCYVPDILFDLPGKQGGWGNYLNTRSRSVEWLSDHIDAVEGASLFLSATTDPYNPYEGKQKLTRRLLEVLAGSKMGFLLISTRGTLVERDIDLFTSDGLRGRVEIGISIPSDLLTVHSAIEPYAPAYARRFEVARHLREAGVPVRIHAAPLAIHSEEFYALAAGAANWLWIDEPEHSADEDPTLAPWFYTDEELQELVRQAPLRPGLGPACVGYGKQRFGWRWDSERGCIMPPPSRVKFPPEKRKGGHLG